MEEAKNENIEETQNSDKQNQPTEEIKKEGPSQTGVDEAKIIQYINEKIQGVIDLYMRKPAEPTEEETKDEEPEDYDF